MLERPQTGILQKKEIPAILNAMGQGRDSLAMDGITPSFALNFAEGGSIRNQGATATFTRATTATVVDQDSIVRTALSGEARMQGLRRVQNCISFLTEGNLVAVGWGVSNSGTGSIAVYTSNFATAPDGTQTAHRVQATLNGGGNNAANSSLLGAAIATTMSTVLNSCWVRTNDGTTKTITLRVSAYNPATDTVVVGPTWQRLSTRVGSSSAAGSNTFCIGLRGDAGSTCSDSCDVLFWHPQCEDVIGQAVQTPGEYVSVGVLSAPYHGANVDGVKYFPTLNGNTVSNNIVTEAAGAYIPASTRLGYLSEGARTNIVLQSNAFTTTWAGTATPVLNQTGPDGTTSGWTITDANAAGFSSQAQTITVPNDSNSYAFSIYVKKTSGGTSPVFAVNLNLTGGTPVSINGRWDTDTGLSGSVLATVPLSTSIGNYWRFYVNVTNNSTGNTSLSITVFPASGTHTASPTSGSDDGTATGSAIIYGSQLEQAAFASSYIPTTTVAVTRNTDALTYPTSPWYNATEGTALVKYTRLVAGGVGVYALQQGASGTNNRVDFRASTATAVVTDTSVAQAALVGVATAVNVQGKAATAMKLNDFALSIDGAAVVTDVSGTMPSIIDRLEMGDIDSVGSNPLYGAIASFAYYPRRLANTKLQNMTR